MHVAIMGARVAAWYGMLWLLCGPRVAGFAGWVDPDTPPELKTTTSFTTKEQYELVMSDEFKRAGRSFKDGDDPMWTGVDKSDDDQTASGRKSLHFYNASQITTEGGKLVITTTTEDTKWKGWNPYKKKYETMSRHFKVRRWGAVVGHTYCASPSLSFPAHPPLFCLLSFRQSGMLQSWNKFCFTGGIIEAELQFPGRHDTGGLWPAFWLLGNLGRATFESSTNLMWPWSYDTCNRCPTPSPLVIPYSPFRGPFSLLPAPCGVCHPTTCPPSQHHTDPHPRSPYPHVWALQRPADGAGDQRLRRDLPLLPLPGGGARRHRDRHCRGDAPGPLSLTSLSLTSLSPSSSR